MVPVRANARFLPVASRRSNACGVRRTGRAPLVILGAIAVQPADADVVTAG